MSTTEAYASVLRELFARRRAGVDLGLSRTRKCLKQVQRVDWRPKVTLQIAGTNGKGSTACFVESVCRQAGLSVGVFSSPHLLSLCERFVVGSRPVSQAQLVAAYREVSQRAEVELTFFEMLTVMAAWIFADSAVDVAIYEVGLGGRLDSTSAVEIDVAAVTGIGMDHCEYLGDSLKSIAYEKAGVFRRDKPAIIGCSAPEDIRRLLSDLALEAGAEPVMVDEEDLSMVPQELSMAGDHQRANAATAVACVRQLREIGLCIPGEALRLGLSQARLSGRLEQVDDRLWIDGAHNAQAAGELAKSVAPDAPWVLLLGLSDNKDIESFLAPLLPLCSHVVATQGVSDRAHRAEDIAKCVSGAASPEVVVEPDIRQALAMARDKAKEGRVLATGSLLFLGDLLAVLGRGPCDPLLVTDPMSAKSVSVDTA